MLLLGAIWGASFLFMRVASPEFGPTGLIFVRLVIASLLLGSIVAIQGRTKELFQNPVQMIILGLTSSAIPFSLFAYATLSLSAGFASVLNATAPFFGALIGVLVLRDSLTRQQWIGLLIGFVGVCILVWDKLDWRGSAVSVAACLVAAFLYGFSAHFSKRKLSHVHPVVVATSSQIAASLAMIPIAWMTWPSQVPSTTSWLAALMLGGLCTGIALAIYFPLLHSIGPTRTMTIAYLIPMFGVMWGAWFLKESISASILAGGSLILSGLVCVTWSATPVLLPTEE
jgi:drug/metabolite transporter (DMT)-like permease